MASAPLRGPAAVNSSRASPGIATPGAIPKKFARRPVFAAVNTSRDSESISALASNLACSPASISASLAVAWITVTEPGPASETVPEILNGVSASARRRASVAASPSPIQASTASPSPSALRNSASNAVRLPARSSSVLIVTRPPILRPASGTVATAAPESQRTSPAGSSASSSTSPENSASRALPVARSRPRPGRRASSRSSASPSGRRSRSARTSRSTPPPADRFSTVKPSRPE